MREPSPSFLPAPPPARPDDSASLPARQTRREAQGVPPSTLGGLTPPRVVSGLPAAAADAAPVGPPAPSSIARAFDALPGTAASARVRGIHENNESWLAMWHILGSAQRRVDMSYFILDRDVFGHAVLGQLIRHRRNGLPVSLLLDASGDTFGWSGFTQTLRGQDYLQELVTAGANVSVYNPAHRKVLRQLFNPGSTFAIASNHDKILATERYAMTGGRNIGKEYFSSRRDFDMPFRDSDVVVDSPEGAAQLRRAVHVEMDRDDLNFRIQPDMFGNLVSREAELLGAAAMMDAWLGRAPLPATVRQRLRDEPAAREPYARALLRAAQQDLAQRRVRVSESALANLYTRALELAENPDLAGGNRTFDIETNMEDARVKALDRTSNGAAPHNFDQIEPGIERLLAGARNRVIITNPYIVVSARVRQALEAAGRRGVKITLLTDSPTTADNPLTAAFFMRQWPKLMARIPNLRVFVLNGDQRMHAKTLVADGEVALIGSSNMDLLSSEINGEIVEVMHSRAAARRLEEQFELDRRDPRNHTLEYTIARDRRGRPLLRDGEPVVTFGPQEHVAVGRRIAHELLWKPLTRLLEEFPQARSLRW